jgi:Protein of unknown function (DUF1616)
MRRKNLDLVVAMTIITMNVIVALLPGSPPLLRVMLALPLVFVLPGYTLTEALFYGRPLNASHRLVLSLGLSLAIDILGGFALNITPIGLRALSWIVLLGLLTTAFSLLIAYLRQGALWSKVKPMGFRFTIYPSIVFVPTIAITLFAILYSTLGAAQQNYPGVTQFWMLPVVQARKSCAVRLGVDSFASTSATYRVTVTMQGTQVSAWPSIVLAPHSSWVRLLPITPKSSGDIYVEARLYQVDKPEIVYRKVNMTFSNTEGSKHEKVQLCGRSSVTPSLSPTSTA